jgi:cell division protein FtsL
MSQENRTRRQMYYIDGSTVKKREYAEAAPQRKRQEAEQPVRKKKSVTYEKAAIKAEKSLAFDFKYAAFVSVMVMIMAAACVNMLHMQGLVDKQQRHIRNLQSQIQTVEEDNAAYEVSLDNMYTLEQIYDIAVNQLGMVYAQKGQIVYYDSANEDYVNQYQDVPEAN